jgi:DNA invertase Pin-like site-specific DNA recombinase
MAKANGKKIANEITGLELASPVPCEEVFYWRVSTGRDQDPDYQIALARKRGIPESNIFGDVASGRRASRNGLKHALMMMEGRPGWTLVLWKLDRLGRDAFGLLGLMKDFKANDWNLVSMTEGLDTRTPMGQAFFGMLAVFAQLESDMTGERTRASMARKKELGIVIGRKTKLRAPHFAEIEDLLLTQPRMTIEKIGKRFKISPTTVNNWFPGWRGKTAKEREDYRRLNPLPDHA